MAKAIRLNCKYSNVEQKLIVLSRSSVILLTFLSPKMCQLNKEIFCDLKQFKFRGESLKSCNVLDCSPLIPDQSSTSIKVVDEKCQLKSDAYEAQDIRAMNFTKKYFVIPRRFAEIFTELIAINASSNMIVEIREETFQGQMKLKVLNLAYNNIAKIEHRAFLDQRNLEILYLNNNNLTNLQTTTFGDLRGLKDICLHENPITSIEIGMSQANLEIQFSLICQRDDKTDTRDELSNDLKCRQCFQKLSILLRISRLTDTMAQIPGNQDDSHKHDSKCYLVPRLVTYALIYFVADLAIALIYTFTYIKSKQKCS